MYFHLINFKTKSCFNKPEWNPALRAFSDTVTSGKSVPKKKLTLLENNCYFGALFPISATFCIQVEILHSEFEDGKTNI